MPRLLLPSLVLGLALSASLSAHVTILPKDASANASQEYTIRVPAERDVPTLSVRLVFPAGLDVLRFRRTPGWTYEVERDASGRITSVTWSGGRIGREEYEHFTFIARAKEPGTFKIDAFQTYDGGEVVAWVDAAGGAKPGPTVTVRAAGGAEPTAAADPFAEAARATTSRTAGTSYLPTILSGLALAVSIGAVALARRRRRNA